MTLLRRSPFALRRAAYSHKSQNHPAKLTVGIRREDPARIWERRCPLTPDAVAELVHDHGVDVLVQPCARRVYTTTDFLKAGAKLHPTLDPAHIIVGIKETPLHEVLTDPLALSPPRSLDGNRMVPRTHVMFSHTIKGQLYNMPLLAKFLATERPDYSTPDAPALLPRLVDYEMLKNEYGERTVGFGWFAGVAGTLEALYAMAHTHLELGVASPFLWTPRPHTQPSLESIRSTLRNVVGAEIASKGTPKSLGPMVIAVTGTGKVAEGIMDILGELPTRCIEVGELRDIVTNPNTDLRKIYVVNAHPTYHFTRRDGRPYDRKHYYAHPEEYSSVFHTMIAPYLSLLLNGCGWGPGFPRLMSNEQLTTTLEMAQKLGKGRFACVGDITCDVEGGLEFLSRHSTLSEPFYSARPANLPAHLPSVTMMAVDILPTALPLEASQHFSKVFMPYLLSLIRGYGYSEARGDESKEKREIREALDKATVTKDGKLYGQFRWLEKPLGVWKESVAAGEASGAAPTETTLSSTSASPVESKKSSVQGAQPKKTILMLGSGMVAAPAVAEICSRPDVRLIVASNALPDAERMTASYPNATAFAVSMGNLAAVENLVQGADVVISLLPVPFHSSVAELCIRHKKHMVTASYISPAMRELHDRAVEADVLLMNEIGLDPGIDHCSAMKLIDSLRAEGKEPKSFTSFCGGLPAPENANVPLGYKFSWNPRGVLTAATNAARFKLHDEICEIDGGDLLKTPFSNIPVSNVLKFEGLANRDSMTYADMYGLKNARTVFRGTLRYAGFANLMNAFKDIGLLETDPQKKITPPTWDMFVHEVQRQTFPKYVAPDPSTIARAVLETVGEKMVSEVLAALRWLEITPTQGCAFDSREAMWDVGPEGLPHLLKQPQTSMDWFASVLAHKLRYAAGERDMVVMEHQITVDGVNGEEVHTSSLVAYGTPEASAMSRTVGLPVAYAALQILDGGVTARGVQAPTTKEVYEPILARLHEAGLGVKEAVWRSPINVEASLRQAWKKH